MTYYTVRCHSTTNYYTKNKRALDNQHKKTGFSKNSYNTCLKECHEVTSCRLEFSKPCILPDVTDLVQYGLPTTLDVSRWDARFKPMVVSGSVFDLGSFGSWLVRYFKYFYGNNPTRAKVVCNFATCISQLALHDEAIRDYERKSVDIATQSLMKELQISANVLYVRISDGIKQCLDHTSEEDVAVGMVTEKTLETFLDRYLVNSYSATELEAITSLIECWLDRVAILAPYIC